MNDAEIAEQLYKNNIKERDAKEAEADDERGKDEAQAEEEKRQLALKKMNDQII